MEVLNMLTIEEVKKGLEDRNLVAVAEKTGLTYSQVYGITSGRVIHAGYDVVKTLSDYLKGHHKKAEGE